MKPGGWPRWWSSRARALSKLTTPAWRPARELKDKGFIELFTDEDEVGYATFLMNEELGKLAMISWRCKARCRLTLSWEPADTALRKLAMRKLLRYVASDP